MGVVLMASGLPMTFEPTVEVHTWNPAHGPRRRRTGNRRTIVRGPVAAIMPIKHLGTNGGGFFGANSAHPFENPTTGQLLDVHQHSDFSVLARRDVRADVEPDAACDRDLCRDDDDVSRHGRMGDYLGFDAAESRVDGPGAIVSAKLTSSMSLTPRGKRSPIRCRRGRSAGGSGLGNLEGKELRFGTSAGATFAAVTTAVTCGSVNCMHDSLNPLAGHHADDRDVAELRFRRKGRRDDQSAVFLIIGVFFAGLMVGRTPEYLGKKVEAREMKLAMLALLIHPIMILVPTGLFAALRLGNQGHAIIPAPRIFRNPLRIQLGVGE